VRTELTAANEKGIFAVPALWPTRHLPGEAPPKTATR
jgi:hypothetical protein